MKSIVRISIFTLLFVAVAAFAQVPAKPDADQVTVKDTDASKALTQVAQDLVKDQKSLNDLFQQARSSLDKNNKTLTDAIAAAQKELNDRLQQDKKYKPELDHIADLQKQLTEMGQKAQTEFSRNVGPVQQRVVNEQAQIQVLEDVVRKENGFPKEAEFNLESQKWSNPAKK